MAVRRPHAATAFRVFSGRLSWGTARRKSRCSTKRRPRQTKIHFFSFRARYDGGKMVNSARVITGFSNPRTATKTMTPAQLIARSQRHKLAATTGDCGTFAIALAKALGESASLVLFLQGDNLPASKRRVTPREIDFLEPNLRHVAVLWRGRLYDVEGRQTIERVHRNYNRTDQGGITVVFAVSRESETLIRNHTNFSSDWCFYYQAMTRPGRNRTT